MLKIDPGAAPRPDHTKPDKTRKKMKPPKRTGWKTAVLALAAGMVLAGAGASLWISALDISKLNHPLPEPSLIYDRNGNPAAELSSSRIDPVLADQIPDLLKKAVVAVEDRRFYEHKGVDVRAIFRALARDLKSQSFAEGGSTITQQLAKNLFLPSDKSLSRKLTEAAYAIKIDMTMDKDEILGLYLNSIYFGDGNWGIQQAAKHYFGKNVQDLNLAECALLAGLPKAPSAYSPADHKDKALERRNVVLSLMKEQAYITPEQYNEAVAQPIKIVGDDAALKNKYPSYVDTVIEEAENLYGYTEGQILSGGLRIYTELDPAIQQAAQDVYADDSFFPSGKADQIVQSGTVVIDQHTGALRAVVGYRGKGVFRGFNHATQLKRQPGSTFKPIVVYGPALEKGYRPSSMLYDGQLNINGYQPQDYDHETRGRVTLAEALTQSWNIPAVWLLNEIGIDTGIEFAARLGIRLPAQDRQLGIALGGLSEGVSPLQIAQAYSAFADLGTLRPAHAISKITTKDGKLIVRADSRAKQVMEPAVAYTMTQLLQNVVNEGTGRTAALNRPTAGKSGTTQLPDSAEFQGISGNVAKDAWFVGYTPELTAAVWMGYDHTDREHYLTTSGGYGPAVVFREIMSRALRNVPVTSFEVPPGIGKFNENPDPQTGGNGDGRGNSKGKEEPKGHETKPEDKGKGPDSRDHGPKEPPGHGKKKKED